MRSNSKYTFTVFTATYNRADTIGRVYQSLLSQTMRDFEWVIVDDGSADETASVVKAWRESSPFPITYFRQENSGKHTAINKGVSLAKGYFFLIVDSDDYCRPEALEEILAAWNSIDQDQNSEFAGIGSLMAFETGSIVGSKFPGSYLDSNTIEMETVHRIVGDKWLCIRTDVLCEHKFPVFPGEKFLAEGVVWQRISKKYKFRFINKSLLVVEYRDDGLSKKSLVNRIRNPAGACLYYSELAKSVSSPKWKIRAFLNYLRFSLHRKKPFFELLREAPNIALACVLYMPAMIIVSIDRKKCRGQEFVRSWYRR